MEWITTTGNKTSSDINTANDVPVKSVITIGNVSVIPLDDSVKKQLGITDDSVFTQEITEDGILLRPRKGSDYFESAKNER